uniref:hypothetical protein n=1 Tax=Dyella silvatica TaxID=2992128 RepID=UPI002259862A
MTDLPDALTNLHDATLGLIEFEWSTRRCTLHFHGAPGGAVQHPFTVVFEGVTEISIPAEHPWGSSPGLLEVDCVEPGQYVLVMQSGDEIWISSATDPTRASRAS